MHTELQIPAMTQAKGTVRKLNQILANNIVPNRDGGHQRKTMADPKLVVTRLIWTAIAFEAGFSRCKSRYNMLYNMVYCMIYNT